jgi:hypothetical protein
MYQDCKRQQYQQRNQFVWVLHYRNILLLFIIDSSNFDPVICLLKSHNALRMNLIFVLDIYLSNYQDLIDHWTLMLKKTCVDAPTCCTVNTNLDNAPPNNDLSTNDISFGLLLISSNLSKHRLFIVLNLFVQHRDVT